MLPLLPFNQAPGLGGESGEAAALLDQMSATPLLSEASERRLTEELTNIRLLRHELRSYLDEYPEMHSVREHLIELDERYLRLRGEIFAANVLLVLSIANRRTRLEFMDRFQYGCMGLWHAIDKFDATTGKRLSTYATYWIIQYIRRGADQDETTIRIPVHTRDILKQLARLNQRFVAENERAPTLEELCRLSGQSVQRIRQAITSAERPLSLFYEYPGSDGTTTLMDVITSGETLEDGYLAFERHAEVTNRVRTILEEMEAHHDARGRSLKRHAQILRLLFYIDEIPPDDGQGRQAVTRTLEEVGQMLTPPITRERTRQLKYEAYLWIRHTYPATLDLLREA